MKKLSFIIIVISVMTFITGCYNRNNSNDNTNNDNKNYSEDSIVISTSVAVTQILDKLGVKLKGVPTTAYELPESTKDAVKVGNPMNPDLEIIKSLNPNVVVSVDTLGDDFKNIFIENNIPSEFVTLTSLQGLKESIKTLGDKFNKQEEAKKLLESLSSKENEILKLNNKNIKPKILIVFAAPGSIMIGTSRCYVGSLVESIGGENFIENKSTPFVQVNMEEIFKYNPDKILVMTHADPEKSKAMVENEFNNNYMWKKVNAIKEDKVYYLDHNKFGMSANLKAMEALDNLEEILYK
ncbi:heme ABC transporter substrate-binding protein IsdE [Clostridium carnis]